jgi:hypothetical protein
LQQHAKPFLWTLKPTPYTFVTSSKFSAALTSPNQNIAAVRAIIFYAFIIRHYRSAT